MNQLILLPYTGGNRLLADGTEAMVSSVSIFRRWK